MTIELMFSGANLVALLAYFMRTESRLTKLETMVEFLIEERRKS